MSVSLALIGCSRKNKLLSTYFILTSSDDCQAHRSAAARGLPMTTTHQHQCVEVVLGLQVGVGEGVIFLTYSSLTSSSDKGDTRLQQLVDWAGPDFDGLIIFDECHKAKNLIPEAGSKSTKVQSQQHFICLQTLSLGKAGLLEMPTDLCVINTCQGTAPNWSRSGSKLIKAIYGYHTFQSLFKLKADQSHLCASFIVICLSSHKACQLSPALCIAS
jgi:hypothetical protein